MRHEAFLGVKHIVFGRFGGRGGGGAGWGGVAGGGGMGEWGSGVGRGGGGGGGGGLNTPRYDTLGSSNSTHAIDSVNEHSANFDNAGM